VSQSSCLPASVFREKTDRDEVDTAVREVWEEIGLKLMPIGGGGAADQSSGDFVYLGRLGDRQVWVFAQQLIGPETAAHWANVNMPI
jgi:8-oxo-dGTP pyrophosphatase MutT (NUDIX family)